MIIIKILTFVLNIPVVYLLYKKIFGNIEGFGEALKWSMIPDLFSAIRGNYKKDIINEMKLSFLIFLCIAIFLIEFWIISSI